MTLKTQDVTLTIPAGKPVNGDIEVTPAGWSDWYEEDWTGESSADPSAPATLAEIVDDLNNRPKNSDLIVTFYPREEGGGAEPPSAERPRGQDGDPSAATARMLDPSR